jgi:uncharacterized protein
MARKSAQFVDHNGYLLVKGCPLSRPGIFDYSAAQAGETEDENHGDLNRIVKVFRPSASVMDPEFIESMKNMPMIIDHDFMIGDESVLDEELQGTMMAPEEKGIDGVLTENIYWADPWLRADLMIYSRRMQNAIRSGKKDVSLGYLSKFEYNPGVWEGQPYDYIQTTMRGNHIALVDEGRVPGARVLDGLVFDSMSFDVPSASTNKPESEPMDEQMMQRLAALLPVLEKLCGAEGAAEADPVAAEEVAPETAEVIEEGTVDETELKHNEHEREAGAEEGVDEVLKRLEAMVARLKEGAGEKAEIEAKKAGDSDDLSETEDEDDSDEVKTGDDTEGLKESGGSDVLKLDDGEVTEQVDAPKGPAKGSHAVGDAAFRSVMAMAADRDSLARRLSKHVGTFDHAKMTPMEVSDYGCKKLGLNVKGNAGRHALNGYLKAMDEAVKKSPVATADSASTVSSGMQAYLNPTK